MSDGNTATAKPDPLIGRTIAERFKITTLIARGGMGKVYRAEQAPLGRVCAVKVLNPNYTGDGDPEFHRRFFREASIASKITHPNSVTIFDYGKTDDDIYYMAMEYLEGKTLHHALREVGTMPEERVGRVAAQICRALREAHQLNVIHRDLKPANVMLTRHDDDHDFVKILDFGLVKQLSEKPEEQLTQTGLFMGSPKYMAPEQIQGGHVDTRTDVYSLGIIMYEMLAGKVPFDRPTSVNILMAHVGEPPPPMREVNPNLVCSPAFEELVMRCIAKNPAERWGSMNDVLQAIKIAHGVSMTGQLAALGSGPFSPYATVPPPGTARSSASVPALRTAPLTPSVPPAEEKETREDGGNLEASGSANASDEVIPPRRSRAWVGLGVVGAAVVGGLLGMIAFRLTGAAPSTAPLPPAPKAVATAPPSVPPPAASPPSAAESEAAQAAPVPSVAPVATESSASTPARTLRIVSEPPGANVREGGKELCPATPCDVVFTGEAADVKRAHRVVVSRFGYRIETRTVTAAEREVSVKLVRYVSRAPTPAESAPEAPTPTPSGFKDAPY